MLHDLPADAHAIVADMLPDGDEPASRLRLALVSRALRSFYGGTLTPWRWRAPKILLVYRHWSPCSSSNPA